MWPIPRQNLLWKLDFFVNSPCNWKSALKPESDDDEVDDGEENQDGEGDGDLYVKTLKYTEFQIG